MGRNSIAVFAVILAALVLFAGCVGRTAGPLGTEAGTGAETEAESPSAFEDASDGVSQEEFSLLESELAGLDGDGSFFVEDEFESDILG